MRHAGAVAAGLALLLALPPLAAQSPLSDPTVRQAAPVQSSQAQPGWRLQSTLVSHARRIAIVNGRVVGEGDRVDGARVERIEHGEVWLQVGDGRLRVGMFGAPAKAAAINEGEHR